MTTSELELKEKVNEFLCKYRIRESIHEAIVNNESEYYGEFIEFIVYESLHEIWGLPLWKEWLDIFNIHQDKNTLQNFRATRLKIVSILVHIKFDDWVKYPNIYKNRQDGSIPFTSEELRNGDFLGGPGDANNFHRCQPLYTPIVIHKKALELKAISQRLPFIRSERVELGEGSFGKVSKEVIAAYQFCTKAGISPLQKKVARKRFSIEADFKIEVENLRALNSRLSRHEYIVRYLALFVTDTNNIKEFNILLPLASRNLKEHLEIQEQVLPLGGLLRGTTMISSAIHWLHNADYRTDPDAQKITCCHMDLKLDNILVYLPDDNPSDPIGKWKITDFGISLINTPEPPQRVASQPYMAPAMAPSRLNPNSTVRKPALRDPGLYTAPEVDRYNKVGRSSDVWSFGCVIFQILIRGTGPDPSKLLEMDKKRNGPFLIRQAPPSQAPPSLNPDVKEWLESNSDNVYIADGKLLVLWMLRIGPDDRPNSKKVDEILRKISKNAPGGAKIMNGSKGYPNLQTLPSQIGKSLQTAPGSSGKASLPSISEVSTSHDQEATFGETPFSPMEENPTANITRLSVPSARPLTQSPEDKMHIIGLEERATKKVNNIILPHISLSCMVAVAVTKTKVYLRLVGHAANQWQFNLSPSGFDLVGANMAGDYLVVMEESQKYQSSGEWSTPIRLFKISANGIHKPTVKGISISGPPSPIDDVIVSIRGSLLFQSNNCVFLYPSWHDSKRITLEVNTEVIREIRFSGDGSFAFVKSSAKSSPTTEARENIRVWRVPTPDTSQTSTNDMQPDIYYYQHNNPSDYNFNSDMSFIPFCKSQNGILWNRKGHLYAVGPGPSSKANPQTTFHKTKHLQGVIVMPDEKSIAVVERDGLLKSKFSTAPILVDAQGRLSIGTRRAPEKLEKLYSPEDCAIAVEQSDHEDDKYKFYTVFNDGQVLVNVVK